MTIYTELHRRVTNYVHHYRDDLEVHDKRWIEENPDTDFIHVARESGTHIYPLPTRFDYRTVPYMFGHSTDECISMGYLKVIRDHHAADTTAVFTVCRKGRFSTITADKAGRIMQDAINKARR